MPLQLSTSPHGGLDLRPTILPQSDAERERARIKRLLDLAQLERLRREPQLEERRLNLEDQRLLQAWEATKGQQSLAERQLAETTQFHKTSTDIDRQQMANALRATNLQDENMDLAREVDVRGHEVTQRGQDMTFNATVRGQNTDLDQTLINAFRDNPELVATTLEKRGVPQLSEALKMQKDRLTAKEVARVAPLMKDSDPKTRAALLYTESQKNPDVGAALQMLYPDLSAIAPPKKGSKKKEALKMFLTGGASHYPEVYRELRSLFAD